MSGVLGECFSACPPLLFAERSFNRRQRPPGRPLPCGSSQKYRRNVCQASSAQSSDADNALHLLELEAQTSSRQARLQELVAAERFEEAAQERDALDLLHLRRRSFSIRQDQARKSKILYKPGQVFLHRHYHYKAVIAKVDPSCQANELWIKQMKVDGLADGREQPFYHTLVDTRHRPAGQTTYVAQENIVPVKQPTRIRHPLIDMLFTGFSTETNTYNPNEQIKQIYDDLQLEQ